MPETTETGTIYPECTALCSDVEQDRDAMHPVVEAAFGLVSSWRIMGSVIAPDTTPATLLAAVEAYEATAVRHGSSRGAPTTPAVGNDVPEPSPAPQKTAQPPALEEPFVAVTRREYASLRRGAGALVAELLEVSANLEEHIQTRADEIAARQAAKAISDANGAIRAVVERMEFDKQRSDALITELRRQLDVQIRNVDTYFPQVKRVQALADSWRAAGKVGEAQDLQDALHPKEDEVTT